MKKVFLESLGYSAIGFIFKGEGGNSRLLVSEMKAL